MADCIIMGNGCNSGDSEVKVLSYIGDGTIPKTFKFDEQPTKIITVRGPNSYGDDVTGFIQHGELKWGDTSWQYMYNISRGSSGVNFSPVSYSGLDTIIVNTPAASDPAGCMNLKDGKYTLYYI